MRDIFCFLIPQICLMIAFCLGWLSCEYYTNEQFNAKWQCTAERVITDTVPSKTECVKYERKDND